MSSLRDLVNQLRLYIPERWLDVLKLDEAGLCSRLELAGRRAPLTLKEAEVLTNVEGVLLLEERLSEATSGVGELQIVQMEL